MDTIFTIEKLNITITSYGIDFAGPMRSLNISNSIDSNQNIVWNKAGADPEFPVGGGANPPGGGHQYTNLPDLLKNCIKLRSFWSVGRGTPGAPSLDPPLQRGLLTTRSYGIASNHP